LDAAAPFAGHQIGPAVNAKEIADLSLRRTLAGAKGHVSRHARPKATFGSVAKLPAPKAGPHGAASIAKIGQ
jgi:hypothetical protein